MVWGNWWGSVSGAEPRSGPQGAYPFWEGYAF